MESEVPPGPEPRAQSRASASSSEAWGLAGGLSGRTSWGGHTPGPQRTCRKLLSELSQPDSGPALPGSQCHALHSPPHPCPSVCLHTSPRRGSQAEPPEARLDVQTSEVQRLDMSCREGGWDGPAGPSNPAACPVAQSRALVSVRARGPPL